MSRKPLPDHGELSLKVYQFLDRRPSTSAELVAALGINPPERISSVLRTLAAKGFIDVVAVIGKGKASQRVWGANRGHDAEICAPKETIEHKRLNSAEFEALKKAVLAELHSAPESALNAGDLQRLLAEKENPHSRYNIASALVWLFRVGCTEKIPPSKGRYASYKWKCNLPAPPPKSTPIKPKPKAPKQSQSAPTTNPPKAIPKTAKTPAPVRQGKPFPCGLETGQKVNTPMGQGRLTSQQGDRLIIKFSNHKRHAFPISEVSA